MAYNVQNGDILECIIKGLNASQVVMSVFHYRLDMAAGVLDGKTTIDTFNTKWNAGPPDGLVRAWSAAVSAQTDITEVSYQWVSAIRRAKIVKTPVVLAGTVVGTASPPNLACALTKKTDDATRRGLGTLHMPGLVNESFNAGRFTVLGLDLYGELLGRLFAPINLDFGQNMTPVVFNRADPAASLVITNSQAHSTVRTMHRRTVGVGE